MIFYTIGEIASAYGVKGEIKVIPLTSKLDRFYKLNKIWIFNNNSSEGKEFFVENVRFISNKLLLKLKDVNDRNAAEVFKGNLIKVDEKNVIELEENEYFISDLINMKVYTEDGILIGTLINVISTGANDVYVVKQENGEKLLPAIKDVIKKVDVDSKVMIVHLLEGL
ncbi:MAG: ribosome maturation factor RimM [Thermoanaerobacteraceae bacterium]